MGSMHVLAALLPIHVLVTMVLTPLVINSIHLNLVVIVCTFSLENSAVCVSGVLGGVVLSLLLDPRSAVILGQFRILVLLVKEGW